MRSRLPKATEEKIRELCAGYPQHKDLIDDALEEALDPGVIKPMLRDLASGQGYANSSIYYMCEKSYKQEKFRAKLCLAQRFGLAI